MTFQCFDILMNVLKDEFSIINPQTTSIYEALLEDFKTSDKSRIGDMLLYYIFDMEFGKKTNIIKYNGIKYKINNNKDMYDLLLKATEKEKENMKYNNQHNNNEFHNNENNIHRYIDIDILMNKIKDFKDSDPSELNSYYDCGYSDCLTAIEDLISDMPVIEIRNEKN